MFRERTFFLLLATFLAVGMFLGWMRQKAQLVEVTLSPELALTGTNPAEREWAGAGFVPDGATPELAASSTVGAESSVVAGEIGLDGDVYLFDWAEAEVERFSPDGTARDSYRWSLAPAENAAESRPETFALGPDGEVWLASSALRQAQIFTADGTPRGVRHFDAIPSRLVVDADGRAVVMPGDNSSDLFRAYSADGAPMRSFGRLFDGDTQHAVIADGMIAADGAGAFVYAPTYVGLLASYTFDGELRWLVPMVGASGELPPILIQPTGMMRVEPGTPRRALTVHVVNDLVYVLAERAAQNESQRILDIYNNVDGSYLRSLRLPNGPRDALYAPASESGERLYTVHRQELKRWRSAGDVQLVAVR